MWGWLPRSLSLFPVSFSPPPFAPSPFKPPEMHIRLEFGGPTHTQVCMSVCLCMWTCEAAEQSRSVKQTDMHVRLPWIQHPGAPLLFFPLKLLLSYCFFFSFFLLLLFSHFLVFWFLVQKSY